MCVHLTRSESLAVYDTGRSQLGTKDHGDVVFLISGEWRELVRDPQREQAGAGLGQGLG